MKEIYWLFFVLLVHLWISPVYCDAEKKLLGEETFNGHDPLEFLPFKVAIPEHFLLHQIEGNNWILFGEKSALIDLENQFVENPGFPASPLSGIIRMRLSSNVAQTGPNTFSGSDDEIKSGMKKIGGTGLRIREMTWGEYPVLIVEAMFRGAPVRMGWVGLNCGGPVMCIDYIFPQGKKSYQHDLEIWNRFLSETKGHSPEELDTSINKMHSSVPLINNVE